MQSLSELVPKPAHLVLTEDASLHNEPGLIGVALKSGYLEPDGATILPCSVPSELAV